MKCRILLLMMSLWLGACVMPGRPGIAPPAPTGGDPINAYQTFGLLDAKARARMLKQVGNLWSRSPRQRDRLNLAMLLAQPAASSKEWHRALRLLDGMLASQKPLAPRMRRLAVLLRDQLRRAQTERSKALALRRRLKARLAASRRLSARLASLQTQLRQLKTIEQNLNERERAIIAPSTPGPSDERP